MDKLFDMENLMAMYTEVVVTISAKTSSIHNFIRVLTVVGHFGSTLDVITIIAHPFGVMRLVWVRTVGNFLHVPFVKTFFV